MQPHTFKKAIIGLVATCVVAASACSTSSDFAEVQATEDDASGRVPTTLIAREQLPSTTSTTLMPTTTTTVPGQLSPEVEAAVASIFSQLAANPDIISFVNTLQQGDLATLFNIDLSILDELELTGERIQNMGAVVVGLEPPSLEELILEQIDSAVLMQLITLADQINAQALAAVDGLSRDLITTVAELSAQVDAELQAAILGLLSQLDPEGLGLIAQDPELAAILPAATSILGIFGGAAIAAHPELKADLEAELAGDPASLALLEELAWLSTTIPPAIATLILSVGSQLTTEAAGSLTILVTILNHPDVQNLAESGLFGDVSIEDVLFGDGAV